MEFLTSFRETLRASGIAPLTHTSWVLLLRVWKYMTLMAPIQLLVDWYPMGKTSYTTLFNVPGKPAWMLSELVSPLTLLYTVYTNPSRGSAPLPKSHIWLTTLFLVHYLHRAVLSPLMGPKIAPFHILLAASMAAFNFCNGSAIGGWLGGFGSAQEVPLWMTVLGSAMFAAGLWGNMYHEEILRDLRKEKEKVEGRRDKQEDTETVVLDGRVYKIPHGGLFEYCWYPHYSVEWFEWTGFMIAGGGPFNFVPAALFLLIEISTMGPRAMQGKRWYLKKFGDKAPDRKVVIPGIW